MALIAAPRPLDWFLLLVPVAAAGFVVASSDGSNGMFVENGPVEMLQLGALAAATALFVRASYRLGGWGGLAVLGLACLSLLFLVRETARCDSPFREFGPCFPGDTKTAFYFLPVVFGIVLAAINPRLRPDRFGRAAFAALPGFLLKLWPLGLLLPLIVGAQIADARQFPIAEELLELTAYVLLVLFGLRAAQAGDCIALTSSPHPLEPQSDPRSP